MKIYFETGHDIGHSVRGIGVHTAQLISALKKLKSSKFQVTQNKKNADIVHFTYLKPFEKSLVPFFKPRSQKWILTIHDLTPLIYPKHYPPGIRGNFNFWCNRLKVKKNIDAIVTISETSKKDICRLLGIDPKIVHVVYLGPAKEYKQIKDKDKLEKIKTKYGLLGKFIFCFGDVDYNKNIPTLAKACKNLRLQLVIAGKHFGEIESLDLNHPELSHLKGLDFSKIIRPGFISDDDANALYNLASVYVQPSFYEGFGLSLIHGFASGCPVIAAKTQALVEVGEDAPLYFDPKDADDLQNKISKVLKNTKLRSVLVQKGFERIKMFSWEKTAKETLGIYEKI